MTAHKVAFRDSSQNASAKYTLFVDLVPALAEHGSERSSPTTAHSPAAPQPHSLLSPLSLSHTAPQPCSPSDPQLHHTPARPFWIRLHPGAQPPLAVSESQLLQCFPILCFAHLLQSLKFSSQVVMYKSFCPDIIVNFCKNLLEIDRIYIGFMSPN